jgi:ribosomal protein S18 acetylase RimI-like enzyme
MEISRLGPGDEDRVAAAADLFDDPPRPDATAIFLAAEGHHLLIATVDGTPAGFVTGVEMTHPDKGTEMFIYELGVDDEFLRRGIAKALLAELKAIAIERGCYGMWVLTEPGNDAALATYRSIDGVDEGSVTFTMVLNDDPTNPSTAN